MYVACPSCKSLYSIEPEHLRAAHGKVRCGHCQLVFDATGAVFQQPEQALEYAALHEVREEMAREIDALVDQALEQVPQEGERAGPVVDEEAPPVVEEPPEEETPVQTEAAPGAPAGRADVDFQAWPVAAEFVPEPSPLYLEEEDLRAVLVDDGGEGRGRHTGAMVAASLVLIALLAGQFAWGERYRLVRQPGLRPLVETFCHRLGCELPLPHDPELIDMAGREVRDHPAVDGVLLINAAFVNRAAWPQAWPWFQVSFSDVSGNIIAARRFAPREYLGAARDPSRGMAPGERVQISLEVVDPGPRASSFQFEFL